MKLYTEELKKKAEAAWEGCHGCDDNDKNMWVNGYITGALDNPIELPSDEEIEKESLNYDFTETFTIGAKWMREQIQGGNK